MPGQDSFIATAGVGLAQSGAVLRAAGLTKTYKTRSGDLTVLADLSFTIEAGERVAIVGASGAGKSTLLHLLGTLDRPSLGSLHYGATDVFSLDDAKLADFRNRTLGFVWQMNSLLAEFTALENAAIPLLVRGAGRGLAADAARERLEEVGLGERLHHRAGELSGGEQQRVALARALVTRPRVLLADEPTGNLDHRTGESVMGVLEEMHRTHRLTSVIVTHNPAIARSCDRILQLDKGVFVLENHGRSYV